MIKDIADRIRMARESRNLTRKDMEVKIPMGESAYARLERGAVKEIGVTLLSKISSILEMDIKVLIEGPPVETVQEGPSPYHLDNLITKQDLLDLGDRLEQKIASGFENLQSRKVKK